MAARTKSGQGTIRGRRGSVAGKHAAVKSKAMERRVKRESATGRFVEVRHAPLHPEGHGSTAEPTKREVPQALQPRPARHTAARRSSYGALKHLGPAPSAEDIDQVRREMWASFTEDEAA